MGRIKSIIKKIISRDVLFYLSYVFLRETKLSYFISDYSYIKLQYRCILGKKLDLENPSTYNEKLQWLKLFDHQDIYTTLVDKYLVKDYIAKIIGNQFIIPTLGVWNSVEEIDFESLPNKFVLKTNHSGGNTGVIICKDKNLLNIKDVKKKLQTSLRCDFYKISREWPYKNIKRKIIAEQYMEDSKFQELRDYKFFCFNGEPKVLLVASGRQNENGPYFDFFDMNYVHLDLQRGHKFAEQIPLKPKSFDLMVDLARKLSKNLPHVRVDLYEVNGKPYFGELTLYSAGGLVDCEPKKWNKIWGDWLNLSSKFTSIK